ncbi:uncharacterized protein LOC109607591 [Aethina tumida]|uniref:uncharacterized protein LOC109607591 n=1 Tax=Aethina tumida TaxID=116153 RepID=UPI00096B59E8|nr:uncharacterized protein LOC109607591 [Aethina tumida]
MKTLLTIALLFSIIAVVASEPCAYVLCRDVGRGATNCDFNLHNIVCPNDGNILIKAAQYGTNPAPLKDLKDRCDGEESCNLNGIGTCDSNQKRSTLRVTYSCYTK